MSNVYSDEDDVPAEVLQALASDTSISRHQRLLSPTQDPRNPENVIFCEPARFSNGLCLSFLLSAFEGNIAFVLLGVYLVQWLHNILYLLVIVAWVLYLWVLLIIFKWRFFGYRVVTNYRAAIVITKNYFCPSGIASSYYKDALYALSRGELTRQYSCVRVQTSFLAKLEYGEGRDGHGSAMINGIDQTLHFGYIRDIQKLEEVLMVGTEAFIGKSARNPQFEYRVENFESCFEFSIILFATLHAIIFVVLGFITSVTIVSGGYTLQNCVLLADLGLIGTICVVFGFTFSGQKFGTNQRILIGKMNYFHTTA